MIQHEKVTFGGKESMMPHITLLALAYYHMPELIEVREKYERQWWIIGAVVILGWVMAYVCFRCWTKPRTSGLRNALIASVLLVTSVTAGFVLGRMLWDSGLLWSWGLWTWGDMGAGQRWEGELVTCALGGAGWGVVLGQVLFLGLLRIFPGPNTKV